MNIGRAQELFRTRELIRVAFAGVGRGYKLSEVVSFNKDKRTIDVIYHNTVNGCGEHYKFTRFPMEMVEEFEGLWHPHDEEYVKAFRKPSRCTIAPKKHRRTT